MVLRWPSGVTVGWRAVAQSCRPRYRAPGLELRGRGSEAVGAPATGQNAHLHCESGLKTARFSSMSPILGDVSQDRLPYPHR